MADDLQAILGELSANNIIGAVYTDINTILSVQKQIQKLGSLGSDYANCPTNKRTNTTIGPKFAKALSTFNKQFGTPSDGGTITDNTLTALKSDRVKTAVGGGSTSISMDAKALVELAEAQSEQKKAIDAKVAATTLEDRQKAQAAVRAADAKIQNAAIKVIDTTDDPTTKSAAESAKSASQDAVNAITPQQTTAAASKVAAVDQQVKNEVEENPAAAAAVNVSLIDVLNRQYGMLPLWSWGLVGAGAIVIFHLLWGRSSTLTPDS